MLNEMIVSRFIAADLNRQDYGTRETVHADLSNAAFTRALGRDTPFARRPNLHRVVFGG